MKHAIRHIHFVGIGGAGMCGIAEVLKNLGYQISGSDLSESQVLNRLSKLGIQIYLGHNARHIEGADAVVTSTAVAVNNPEVVAARASLVPVVPRAVMLAELMRFKQGIAIAGTHGKTTTTSLVASILAEAGMDPTYVIGGLLNSADANAKLGHGEYIVVEADESDASFLNLTPVLSVVTNIDNDHMDTYGQDFSKLKDVFIEFLHRLPFYGAAILCSDDPPLRSILQRVSRPIVTYGLGADAHLRAEDIHAQGTRMHFRVTHHKEAMRSDLQIDLNLPGIHNVRNALAAIAVAHQLGVPDAAVCKALAEFKGIGRRFQLHGQVRLPGGGSYTLVEDYGHHPVELQATYEAARAAFPGRFVRIAFQPHRYTRTRDCFEDFVRWLARTDGVWLTEVYAAGEAPIAAADGRSLAHAIRAEGLQFIHFSPDIDAMALHIESHALANDVVLCMGAGSIGQLPALLKQRMVQ